MKEGTTSRITPVSVILLLLPLSAAAVSGYLVELTPPTTTRTIELMPDPFFTQRPDFEIMGNSSEFRFSYNQGENNRNWGIM